MLSRPGEFWSFRILVTALRFSMVNGSVFMLSVPAIWTFGSLWSSEIFGVAPRRFLKWSYQLCFLSEAEPPFSRINGLLLPPVRSLIVSQAVTC